MKLPETGRRCKKTAHANRADIMGGKVHIHHVTMHFAYRIQAEKAREMACPCRAGNRGTIRLSTGTIDNELVTTRKEHYFVIPVKTGIQHFQLVTKELDTRLRGYDELLHVHH